MRFRHGKARNNFIVEQWLQEFFLLLRRTVVRQDFRIAGVRRLRAKDREELSSPEVVSLRPYLG